MEQILIGFKDGLKGLDKNGILVAKEDKNDITCQMIIDQVAETDKFVVPEKVFGDATCAACNGLGYKLLFNRTLSVRVCLKCTNGRKKVPCTKCQNGRYIREKGDLKINVECKFCHGTKQRDVKCRTCRGTGELRKMVITPDIKSTTPCKKCHELGFIDEQLFAIINDTAKYADAADMLIDCLMEPQETNEPIDIPSDPSDEIAPSENVDAQQDA